MISNIFDYITTEEASYKSTPIPVADGYEWHMPEHIRACTLYKDGKLLTGNDQDKPVKNIILPILNVAYRTEGFDVKDIEPYVNSDKDYHKSFLLRKFHEKWAREQSIDTFIDEIVESYVDYGGVLVKNGKDARPEVIPLQKLAFCDQTDILSGPFCIKHQFSIDQLKEKSGVWSKESIDEIVTQSRAEKSVSQSNDRKAKTTGKYIEIFEVHGCFPESWVTGDTEFYNEYDEDNYVNQVHIVSFITDRDLRKHGITLFRGKEKTGNFKVLRRDKRFGTALGRSAIEELIEPQVWTNYSMIQIKKMLDKASLLLAVEEDSTFTSENNLMDLDQGTIMKGKITPFVFPMGNLQAFDNMIDQMENQARIAGSASESQLGITPVSGTPLGTTQIVTGQSIGIHDYRRGQIATFVEEIYRDWIIPSMVTEINRGQKFLMSLSLEELTEVSDNVVNNLVKDEVKEKLLKGKLFTKESAALLEELTRARFMKGEKKFIEILQDDFKDMEVDVMVNVAGKQKNLAVLVDKLSNLFRIVMANPMVLQDPNAAKLMNNILEFSGMSPLNIIKVNPQQPTASPMTPMQSGEPMAMQSKEVAVQ